MLLRLQKKQTWIENVLEAIGSGLRVDILAEAMMLNAEKIKIDSIQKSVNFFKGNKVIRDYLDKSLKKETTCQKKHQAVIQHQQHTKMLSIN